MLVSCTTYTITNAYNSPRSTGYPVARPGTVNGRDNV